MVKMKNQENAEYIYKVEYNSGFTIVPTAMLNDNDISFAARGMNSMILSKPSNWKVNVVQLENESNTEKGSIRKYVNELIKSGYWNRYPLYFNGRIASYEIAVSPERIPKEKRIAKIIATEENETEISETGEVKTRPLTIQREETLRYKGLIRNKLEMPKAERIA